MPEEVFCTQSTLGPWEIVKLDSPLDDWSGAQFVIRSPVNAPGGIAMIMGGLGLVEETANAALIAAAPAMFKALDAATHALRSYQYGNASTEFAKATADYLEKVIRDIREQEQ